MRGTYLTNDTTRIAVLVNSVVGLPTAAGVSSFDYRIRIAPNV